MHRKPTRSDRSCRNRHGLDNCNCSPNFVTRARWIAGHQGAAVISLFPISARARRIFDQLRGKHVTDHPAIPATVQRVAEVPSAEHTVLAMLAQDSLLPAWEALPERPVTTFALRDAARTALRAFHEGTAAESALPSVFAGALPAEVSAQGQRCLNRMIWRDCDWHFSLWQGALSANQWERRFGSLEPEIVHSVTTAYRRDVVGASRAVEARFPYKLPVVSLSPWDSFLHTAYGFSFGASDEWPESLILLKVQGLVKVALFEQFLRRTVLALSPDQQHALADAVRAYWRDLWSPDQDEAPVLGPSVDPADADEIPEARDLLSKSD